ncbi:hypothetical protein [Actinoplanes siamensis]|uniref:Uncharacterized protein n=1 Tax=Actinoplanes siamensis TaxID=1223317 RepID=A0A919N5T0_9ACTN|nr:hypothetical protein [Actinoplanes siamensis]GIF04905.1 hypothetical protein Asi03nite_24430 [Actinoplanes siamensis]
MTAVAENDLQQRRTRIRQRELLLTLQRWAPAYRDVAGDCLSYVFELADATEPEREWLRQQVAQRGLPQVAGPTIDQLRAEGRRANAAASAAFLVGDHVRARDLIDDARVYGALFETEWVKLHQFISAQSGYTPGMSEKPQPREPEPKQPVIERPIDLQDEPDLKKPETVPMPVPDERPA